METTNSPSDTAEDTGKAPAGSAMSKEFQVASVSAPVLVWASLAIGAMSFFFHIIGFSLAEWLTSNVGKAGLWRVCTGPICFDIPTDPAVKCSQAFATMAFVLMLGTLILTVVFIYLKHLQNETIIRITLIASHGISAFFLMIAFSVYSGEIINKTVGSSPGAAFGLEVFCFILEIGAAVVLSLDLFIRKQ